MWNWNSSTWVYICYGDNDEVIYVGVSSQPKARLKEHKAKSTWFPLCRNTDMLSFDDRHSALLMEKELIRKEKPRFNLCLNANFKRAGRGRMVAA